MESCRLARVTNGEARFAPDALPWLKARRWPGNVRELRAAIECAAALAPKAGTGISVSASDLAFATGEAATAIPVAGDQTLEQEVAALERRRISEALERTGRNHTHAARELGLSRVGLLKNGSDGITLKRYASFDGLHHTINGHRPDRVRSISTAMDRIAALPDPSIESQPLNDGKGLNFL